MCKNIFDDMPIISAYTLEQAISDGILVKVGQCGRYAVIFTANLFYDGGYEDKDKRMILVQKGIEMLKQSGPEDSDCMRLRVVEKDKIWVIADGQAVTFMRPEDY
ncbi:MAG: hypothetical protein A2252_09130 [Elusimicrobia bacterium RIFOXYA2_FULL_39_19]|nr:MAG: hypothetical protein A2252_09130 [Elusimicrobia bacterium RIFOXYA2_FULL_39_19]